MWKFIRDNIVLMLPLLVLAGCNNSYLDEVDRGADFQYKPGYPELRLATSGYVNQQNEPILLVSGDVVYGSLIYRQANDMQQAEFSVEVQLVEKGSSSEGVKTHSNTYTITDEDANIINSQDVYRFNQQYRVEPGTYTVFVTITDLTSQKVTTRSSEIFLPDPEDEISHITEIRVLGRLKPEPGYIPITSYHIQNQLDTLKLAFQVTQNDPDESLILTSRLVKFKADTSAARPMSYHDYAEAGIEYVGIKYDDYEEIQNSRRVLTEPGIVLVEFHFTNLEEGNYRFEVSSDSDDNELYKARDFSIKSKNFPSVKSPRELAAPLAYIMDQKEYKKLMSIKSADSLKQAVDRFWLSNVKNSNRAREVISMYYQRVEEANKQFSNFKEGWKTDPGMMYILFGPPWYVDHRLRTMRWSYSYNTSNYERTFYFQQYKLPSKYYPFNHYILDRSQAYHTLYYQQVQDWLTGRILTTNL